MGASGSNHEPDSKDKSSDSNDQAVAEFGEALAAIRRGEVHNAVLTGLVLGPSEIEELCKAFAFTESVKALELDRNQVGNEGAVRLADTLARDDKINLVDLTENGIG